VNVKAENREAAISSELIGRVIEGLSWPASWGSWSALSGNSDYLSRAIAFLLMFQRVRDAVKDSVSY
jgi:hypothetical protein